MLKQVRQQNAYPQYEGVQLKQRLRPKLAGSGPGDRPPPYKGNISIADAAIARLYLLKTIKINAGVQCRCGMKKIANVDEYLVDHCWIVVRHQHLDGPVL